MGQIAIRTNFIKRLNSGLPQSVYTLWRKSIVYIYRILASIPLRYPDPNFRSIPRNAEGYFSIPHPVQTSIPSLAPILVKNPESRPSNKENPASLKLYCGPPIVGQERMIWLRRAFFGQLT